MGQRLDWLLDRDGPGMPGPYVTGCQYLHSLADDPEVGVNQALQIQTELRVAHMSSESRPCCAPARR